MITMNRKWMRLMVLVGCAALAASCKQAPAAQTEAEYAVLRVSPSDKVLSTTYSATIRGRQDIDIYPQVSGFLTQLFKASTNSKGLSGLIITNPCACSTFIFCIPRT